jgi:hypothetical protein
MAISQHQVPKKLTTGMAVVAYLPPTHRIAGIEARNGVRVGKWFKASIYQIDLDMYTIQVGNILVALPKNLVILVRSTSWNDSDAKVRADKRNAVRNRK